MGLAIRLLKSEKAAEKPAAIRKRKPSITQNSELSMAEVWPNVVDEAADGELGKAIFSPD